MRFPSAASAVPIPTGGCTSNAKVSEGIRQNWWRQGMMGAATAHYQCVKVLSEAEFYDDLKIIDVPVLVMPGEDDQICPFPTTGARSVKLLKQGALKSLSGIAAWNADNPCGINQRRSPGVHRNQSN